MQKTQLTVLIEKIDEYIHAGTLILGMEDVKEAEIKFTERMTDCFKIIRGEAILLLPEERKGMEKMYKNALSSIGREGQHIEQYAKTNFNLNFTQYKP